ncbi:MAG: gliding motility lipoprotein GldB [Cytophagaceae bacterium]|nr:gliding motility lipoprotein GldB [Cytophagaceae bacterium]
MCSTAACYKSLLAFLALTIITACDQTDQQKLPVKKVVIEEEKMPQVQVKVERLEQQLFSIKKREEVVSFLKNHPAFCQDYLDIPNASQERVLVDKFLNLYSNAALRSWNQEVQKEYGDFSELSAPLNAAFSYVKYYYPKDRIPEVNTIVTGFQFDRDFSFSDSLIVVSIDYLMPDSASYKPDMFGYILKRYKKEYLVPMMMMAVSSKYNEHNPKDETMLANIIHYGKAHYFVERMMPDLHDSLNIGYSAKELKETEENLGVVWGHFIEKKLFFETNPKLIQKYCGESPKVVAIGDNCPGRIGRWLGWQIIRKYMKEHPEVSLQQLMKEKDANKLFKESKFKGPISPAK